MWIDGGNIGQQKNTFAMMGRVPEATRSMISGNHRIRRASCQRACGRIRSKILTNVLIGATCGGVPSTALGSA